MHLLAGYGRAKVVEQIKSVALIVAYLVLRDPPPLPPTPGAKDAGFRGFLELLRMPLLLP